MTTRAFITQTILWLFVIFVGIHIGAGVYEVFVITPLWAGMPPESVTGWNPVPQYAINPAKYWGIFSPVVALLTLALLIAAWLMPPVRRKWALVAGVCLFIVVLSTVLFFVPILIKTIGTRGSDFSSGEITTMVNQWVGWNWLRLAVMIVGWLAAIRALSISSAPIPRPQPAI